MCVLISVAASLMLMLALVGPVAAAGPGCSDFGAGTAGFAQAGGFGKLVSGVAHDGITIPDGFPQAGVFYADVSQLIKAEHTLGIFAAACAKFR